jgi:hypothetical protein
VSARVWPVCSGRSLKKARSIVDCAVSNTLTRSSGVAVRLVVMDALLSLRFVEPFRRAGKVAPQTGKRSIYR